MLYITLVTEEACEYCVKDKNIIEQHINPVASTLVDHTAETRQF